MVTFVWRLGAEGFTRGNKLYNFCVITISFVLAFTLCVMCKIKAYAPVPLKGSNIQLLQLNSPMKHTISHHFEG